MSHDRPRQAEPTLSLLLCCAPWTACKTQLECTNPVRNLKSREQETLSSWCACIFRQEFIVQIYNSSGGDTAASSTKMLRAARNKYNAAGQGIGFYTGDDGYLYCDDMKVEDCRLEHLAALEAAGIPQQPMYLYSKAKLTANYNAYKEAFGDLPHIIGYAVKANNNLPIMKLLQSLGSGAVLVSGNELKLAMAGGFDTTKYVFMQACSCGIRV